MTTGAFGIGLTFIGRKGPGPYEYLAVPTSWKLLAETPEKVTEKIDQDLDVRWPRRCSRDAT